MLHLLSLAASVLAIGENCASTSKTSWENHYCSVKNQPQVYQKGCLPIRTFPGSATALSQLAANSVKGVVILYHGYTACPDAMQYIAADLNKAGYLTYIPLVVGMGLSHTYQCNVPGVCVGKHPDNPSQMPVARETYQTWVQDTIKWVQQDVALIPAAAAKASGFSWSALGLSLGGPLSLYAAQIPGNPFKNVLLINPFLGISLGPLDFEVYYCQTQANPAACAQKSIDGYLQAANATGQLGALSPFLNQIKQVSPSVGAYLVGNYDKFMQLVLTSTTASGNDKTQQAAPPANATLGWGDSCIAQVDRPGYCDFRLRNLLAMQAFVALTVGKLSTTTAFRIALLTSDYDGPARDSISFAITDKLAKLGKVASRCHWQVKCSINQYEVLPLTTKLDVNYNGCGVPHACCSRIENKVNMYWEADMFKNIRNFINGATTVGTQSATDLSQCVTTTKTLGYNQQFDRIGPQYVVDATQFYSK